jgi:hypothetical protein
MVKCPELSVGITFSVPLTWTLVPDRSVEPPPRLTVPDTLNLSPEVSTDVVSWEAEAFTGVVSREGGGFFVVVSWENEHKWNNKALQYLVRLVRADVLTSIKQPFDFY